MSALIQYLFSGLTVGSMYALAALGYALIYNASHIVNFAQGEFVMLGTMSAILFLATYNLPVPVAIGGKEAVLGIALSGLPRSGKSATAVIIPIALVLQFISGVYLGFSQLPEWLQASFRC